MIKISLILKFETKFVEDFINILITSKSKSMQAFTEKKNNKTIKFQHMHGMHTSRQGKRNYSIDQRELIVASI